MSTTVQLTRVRPPELRTRTSRGILVTILLVCGVAYPLVWVVANDVVAATMYEGYSRMSQAISELSATSAPTKPFLTALMPVFMALLIAFGIGVWRSAGSRRALRVTGGILVAWGASTLLWLPFPMSSRVDMVPGQMPVTDVGHIVLGGVTTLLMLSAIGFGAAAFGRRFRVYSIVTAATALIFGALTGMESSKLPAGEPTPWMGLYERISIWACMLWVAVFAIALLQSRSRAGTVEATGTMDVSRRAA